MFVVILKDRREDAVRVGVDVLSDPRKQVRVQLLQQVAILCSATAVS